jgi:membrane protease YdiL (CAAX protease family)
MWVILYLAAIVLLLLGLQSVVLIGFKQPLQWTFGANSHQPKKLKLALKGVLQTTLVGSILLFPFLIGSKPAAYYGPRLPLAKAHYFLYGEAIAILLLGLIFGIELGGRWIYYQPRFPAKKALTKSTLSTLSSFTVVAVEEPFFRGIILQTLLSAAAPALAVPLSAVLFSAAHYIRKVRTYWPSLGLAVLGLWLGVAYYKTGSFWLPMGLHSGGILSIGIHRCYLNYRGPAWLVGTQTYPIAGLISILVMLLGTVITWVLF